MRLAFLLSLCWLTATPTWCQELTGFTFTGYTNSLDNQQLEGHYIGGLSGITYDETTGRFLAITDNSGAKNNITKQANIYSFLLKQDSPENLTISDVQVLPLKGELAGSHPESIRSSADCFFISNETASATAMLKTTRNGDFLEEIYSTDEIRFNSGFEGVCVSEDEKHLYFSLERPGELMASRSTEEEENLGVINVYRYNTDTKEIDGQYLYPLHLPPVDAQLSDKQTQSFIRDNGVTEILLYNESTLLLLERAFLGGTSKKLHVRIYKVDLTDDFNILEGNFELLQPELVFDFYKEELPCEIDNVEGMTFGPDKQYLYLIADDNFDTYGSQISQILSLKVNK